MKVKRNSSLLAILASALIALALAPAIAVADPGGDLALGTMDTGQVLKVANITVSSSGNVTGDGITGTVTYNSETKTLTLADATITYDSGNAIYTTLDQLTITGSGTINATNNHGIYAKGCNLVVSGTGNGITINGSGWGIASDHSAYGATDGRLALSGTVKATSANRSALYAYTDLSIANDSAIIATSSAATAGNGFTSTQDECYSGIFSTMGTITISGGTVNAAGYAAGILSGSYEASNSQGKVVIAGGAVTATGHHYGIYGKSGITISGGTVTASQTCTDGAHFPGAVGVYAMYSGISVGSGISKISVTASNDDVDASEPAYAMSGASLGNGLQFTKPSGGYIGGVNFGGPRNPDGTCAKTVVIEPVNTTTVLVPDEAVTSNLWYTGEEQTTLSNSSTLPDTNDPVNHSLWDGFEWKGVTRATDAGTYTAIAHLTGGKTWSDGTTADREYQWTIQPSEIKADNSGNPCFYGTIYTQIYTGAAITPSLPGASVYVYKNYVDKDGGIIHGNTNSYSDKFITGLTAGKDYNITSYSNNVNVGDNTATATVRFNAGNLTGEDMQLTFSIKEGVELPVGKTLAYTGKEQIGVVLDAGAKFTDENYKATDPGDYGTWVKRTDGKYWIVHEDGGGTHGSESYRIWWKITGTAATKIAAPTGKTLTYTGATQTGVASGTGYTLSGTAKAINAGSYTATATLKSGYAWADGTTAAKKVTWKIDKAANKLAAKAKTTKKKPLSAKKAKATTFKVAKYATVTNPAKGALAYKKTSGNKKIKVNAKTGKLTVPKGLAKKTYPVKVKVTSAATANYKSASKTVTLYVKVK